MPEYLTPGVYTEEIEIGAKPIEGISTSTVGFLGPTERGPTNPELVTNFGDFQNTFGVFVEGSYLAYGVQGFFSNGGQRCFIGRIVGKNAKNSTHNLTQKEDDADKDILKITAIGPGVWGDNIAVNVEPATLFKEGKNQLFKLTVKYWKSMVKSEQDKPTVDDKINAQENNPADVVEVYDNLSPIAASSDYYEKRINGISNLVNVEAITEGHLDPQFILLENGDKGAEIKTADYTGNETAPPGERTGLAAFEEIDNINIVCVPDENSSNLTGLTGEIVGHCERMKDRFAILQAKQSAGDVGKLEPPLDSKYAAFYYPWITVIDPVTNNKMLVPPGGHIAGIYARSDTERGVHKAPANEVVRGAQELQFNIKKGEQAILNPKGVNCMRVFPGRGIRVWGARTTSTDPLWKYLNVRRLFLYIEGSIEQATQWVVFEPNNERLWARVKQSITQFLTTVWRDGALMGMTPDEAFFVKCDRTTMTQDDIDNGRLIVMIGIAPVKPAEFVIFRIAQWTGGSE